MATPSNPMTAASTSVPPVSNVPASPTAAGPPRSAPVVGSSAPAEQPAKALDQLSESATAGAGGIFASVQGMVDKISTQAKPYVDNAGVKIDQFIDRIEGAANNAYGQASASSTTVGSTGTTTIGPIAAGVVPPTEKSVTAETTAAAQNTASVASANASAVASTVSEKAQGLFAAVQSNFEKLTHTIEEKTASPSHPGVITQITQAVEKGMQKVDQLVSDNTTTAHPPVVQTTTNSVPHEGNAPTTSTGTAPSSAPVLGAGAATGTRADGAFAAPL